MRLPATLPAVIKPLLCFFLIHTSAVLALHSPLRKQAPLSVFQSPDSTKMPANNMATDPDNLSPLAEQRILDTQTLFAGKPSLEIFGRSWAPDATFEDPICVAYGWQQYSAQWWAMRLLSTSTTTAWRVTKDEPQEVHYVQKQKYGINKLGLEKEMISTVVMKLDEKGRIKHFEDRWNHKKMPGFWAYPLRRLNALTVPWFIGHPKDHPDAVANARSSGGHKKEL